MTNSTKTPQFSLDILQTSVNFGNINALAADTFNYILVNKGNQPISFSNFSISSTQYLSFAAGSGVNQSLNPGEAIQISIVANTQGAAAQINETLDFNTSLTGLQSSFTIPITANAIITSLADLSLNNQIEVYPNPFENSITIANSSHFTNYQIQLVDAVGKIVFKNNLTVAQNDYETLDLSSLNKGVYFLSLSNGKEVIVRRLVK